MNEGLANHVVCNQVIFRTNLVVSFWNVARHEATCNYVNFKVSFKCTTVTCNIKLHQSKKWKLQFYLAGNGKPTSNHLAEPSTTQVSNPSSLKCYYDQQFWNICIGSRDISVWKCVKYANARADDVISHQVYK